MAAPTRRSAAAPTARCALAALVLVGLLASCSGAAPDAGGSTSSYGPSPTEGPASGPSGVSSSGGSDPSASATASGSATAAPTGTSTAETPPDQQPSDPAARRELPRGGTEVFPRYRLVGYVGLTGSPTLGRLGTGPLDERIDELERRAKPYGVGREVLPVIEIIATIVHGSPGRDGKYRTRLSDAQIERYLKAARRHKALLLLDIQPGRSDFLTELRSFRRWLEEPDVGVALDPEWAMGPGQVPGRVFGTTTGAELDRVARYLSDIVEQERLPEKVLVYHQLAPRIVRRESGLKPHPGVAVVKSVDGIGSRAAKANTYRLVNETTPDHVAAGFKLFYDEDRAFGPLMTPKQVLALRPRPAYVMYE